MNVVNEATHRSNLTETVTLTSEWYDNTDDVEDQCSEVVFLRIVNLLGFSFFGLRLCLELQSLRCVKNWRHWKLPMSNWANLNNRPTSKSKWVKNYSYLASWGWLITTGTFVFLYIKRAEALEMFTEGWIGGIFL